MKNRSAAFILSAALLFSAAPSVRADNDRLRETDTEVIRVCLGDNFSGALTRDGSLYTWGLNTDGQLGRDTDNGRGFDPFPEKVMDGVSYFDISGRSAAAVASDGSLYVWGSNEYGQLGVPVKRDGEENRFFRPVKIMDNAVSVSLGSSCIGAVTKDGSLYMRGSGGAGQLGCGAFADCFSCVKIMDGVSSVSLGSGFGAAVTADGELYTWGYNSEGQLGQGHTENRASPVKIMDGIASVSLGMAHGAAVARNGDLYMWGLNYSGQLGNGTYENSLVPVKVMENVVSADLSGSSSAAVTRDGSAYIWGSQTAPSDNGSDITHERSVPAKFAGNAVAAAAGYLHCAAVKRDGSLYTMGANDCGQLGNGKVLRHGTVYELQRAALEVRGDHREFPEITSVSRRGRYVTLKWRAAENADRYRIYIYENGEFTEYAETSKTVFHLPQKTVSGKRAAVTARINGEWTEPLEEYSIPIS